MKPSQDLDAIKAHWLAHPEVAAQAVIGVLQRFQADFTPHQAANYQLMLETVSGAGQRQAIAEANHLRCAHQDILAIWIPAYIVVGSRYWSPGYLSSGFGVDLAEIRDLVPVDL